jgi:hypothetical protein
MNTINNMNNETKNSPPNPSEDNSFLTRYHVEVPKAIASLVVSPPDVLRDDYKPSEYDVVSGKGKTIFDLPGNQRFRMIVAEFAEQYEAAKTKQDKSIIIDAILDKTREQTNQTVHFLKFDKKTNQYTILNSDQIREAVGHKIRDSTKKVRGLSP